MRYEGQIYRPPSEAGSYILQATIGCSWNHCTYCDMYRAKRFRVRALDETLADIRTAGLTYGGEVDKVFVADGDALVMELEWWQAILAACREAFPRLRRVSAYATAMNPVVKPVEELGRRRGPAPRVGARPLSRRSAQPAAGDCPAKAARRRLS